MIFIDELKPLKLYKKPFHLPIVEKDKRKGSLIFLLSPDYDASKKILINPLLINKNYFKSYYIEKNITYYINEENRLIDSSLDIINESKYINKKELNKDDIIYLSESEKIKINKNSYYMNENYMRCKVGNKDIMFIFNENKDKILNKNFKHNKMLYKLLYRERLKTNKEIFMIYDKVKEDIPWIKKTYIDYKRYKNFNLIIDLSFYNKTFFKNNIYRLDKGVDLYFDFINRFINDKRLNKYKKKTVFVPVKSWYNPDKSLYKYNKDINPISMIFRIIQKKSNKLKMWKDIDFVFIANKKYFKANLSNLNKQNLARFKLLIDKLLINTEIPDDQIESKKSIISNVVNQIENGAKIKINNLTGDTTNINKQKSNEIEKNEIVKKIEKAASTSNTSDETIDKLDNDSKLKEIINHLQDEESNNVKINAARGSRISQLQNKFLDLKINDTSIKNMIKNASNNEELPSSKIEVDTVNEEFNDMKYINFEKVYNYNDDIITILNSLSKKTMPIMIRDIDIEDTSTSEDYVNTWNVKMEDYKGTRFSIKFDIPKLIDNKFFMLRGNKKTINGQLIQIPITKTDEDTVQIVSNYNKIFIRRFGTTIGKSYVQCDRIIKTLNKCNNIKISEGDNRKICSLYELPIDYIDFASIYNKIETDTYIIYFNQDEIREKYNKTIDKNKGIPIAYNKNIKKIIYFSENYLTYSGLLNSLLSCNKEFSENYKNTNKATRYTYSKASILNTEIPLIVIMGYCEGLIKSMKKADIDYKLSEKRLYDKKKDNYDEIKFKDGFLYYQVDYNSSLLMNGLKECNTEDFSLGDINNKSMFLEFLELFGSRILADGLDNFYNMMIDPITEEVLKRYNLPTDYIEILAYANVLLCDNKYIKHTDMRGRRYRSNEIIAGYVYKSISEAYGNYQNEIKRKGTGTMTIKQSDVLDKILLDPTLSDLSILNDLLLAEAVNTVSFKGLSGMNSDRSYNLDKRTYDKSMLNILGLSTGFAGNVGISRQSTLDMNVESKRGYLKIDDDPNDLNITKTFTATEALTPFGVTRDDPFRSAMTFIQTSKHGMRIKKGMPSLISNGTDQVLPYITPNIFSYKSKNNGKIVEKTENYMIIKYKDGTADFIDLRKKIEKNSNGGFYNSIKLDSDLNVGNKVKPNQIVAYDKLSYSDKIGDQKNISYILGALTKFALLNTDEGYEDSAIISNWLSDIMSSEVVIKKDVVLDKNTNIFNMVKKGQPIQEGDPLLIFQNAFEDEDVNILLKNITDEKDISDLGRIPIRSNVTGIIDDIKIYRTVEKDELSDSLRKKVNEFEKETKQIKKVMKTNKINDINKLDPDYKLENSGKLKNVDEGVLIEFFLRYDDKMAIGDKLIYYSALKGVVKDIFPEGEEPSSEFRPDEKIHTILSLGSVSARMVCSILINMGINKTLIELDRKVKDILDIKWKYLDKMIK